MAERRVGADELTRTVLCKVPGCGEDALALVGTWALLCLTHKEEKQRRNERRSSEILMPAGRARARERHAEAVARLSGVVEAAYGDVVRLRTELARAERRHRSAVELWRQATGRAR